MPGRQKAEVLARCPAWLLANADHVFAHAAASVHTAYFSTGLRHSNWWQNTRRLATSSLFQGLPVRLVTAGAPWSLSHLRAPDQGGGGGGKGCSATMENPKWSQMGWAGEVSCATHTFLPAGFQKKPGVGTKEAFCLSEFDVCFAFDKPLCKPPLLN